MFKDLLLNNMLELADIYKDVGKLWIFPLFIWVYISYHDSTFINKVALLFAIIFVGLQQADIERLKLKGKIGGESFKEGADEVLTRAANIPTTIIQGVAFVFTLISIITLNNYKDADIFGYGLYYVSLAALFYMVIYLAYLILSKNIDLLQYKLK